MKPVLKLSEKYLLDLMSLSSDLSSDEQILSAFANISEEEEEEAKLPKDVAEMAEAIESISQKG